MAFVLMLVLGRVHGEINSACVLMLLHKRVCGEDVSACVLTFVQARANGENVSAFVIMFDHVHVVVCMLVVSIHFYIRNVSLFSINCVSVRSFIHILVQ